MERIEKNMGKLFGTDGIRGIANTELTASLAFKTGQSGAYVLTKTAKRRPRILIGKDTRKSGDMLEAALTAGLCSVGAKVISLGVIPTPAVAYLTRLYDADAGVVISASHNPCEYNGIRFCMVEYHIRSVPHVSRCLAICFTRCPQSLCIICIARRICVCRIAIISVPSKQIIRIYLH